MFVLVEGDVVLYDADGNPVSVVNDGGVRRLASESKILNVSGSQINPATQETLTSIKDTDGIKKITDPLPAGSNLIGTFRLRDGDGAALVDVVTDPEDGLNRLPISGKVSISSPATPSTAVDVTIPGDTPLSMTGTEDSTHVISDGKTFTVKAIEAGAAGDPTEKGSRVDAVFDENGTEKVIARIYLTGQTVALYPDTSEARDGTSLDGNVGGTNKIILRRVRLSGVAQEVDAVLRGYEQ